jgi:hypothetical protein
VIEVSVHEHRWTCGWCDGLGVVGFPEDEGSLIDCPVCALARERGVVYEVLRRNTTPVVGPCERVASSAVMAPTFVYEVWEFRPATKRARRVAVELDAGLAYERKWALEEGR